MKSSKIKNWNYTLSYKEIVLLEDFPKLLLKALAHDNCLQCGGDKVLHDGLCIGCGMSLTSRDRKVSDYLLDNVKVTIKIDVPDKLDP